MGLPTVPPMPTTVTAAEAQRFACDVARRIGASDEDAARLAELLVRAEVGGHPGHGLRRLSQYVNAWRNGTIVPSARAEIVRDEGSTVTLDGRRALGQVVGTLAADLAATRALEHGVSAVAVHHSGHAGRLADFADRACGHGAAVLLFANDSGASQAVAPPGARDARLSTNPLAAGIPRLHAPHFVVDLSTSVAAHGKVQVLQDSGLPVPETWMRDGLLQPLGGAKGFALGLLVEALAGVVTGAGAVSAAPGADDQGVFLLAFDPGRFGPPAEVAERLEAMLAYVLGAALEPGAEPLRAPGATLPPLPLDPDARLELTPALAERLVLLAGELGVAPVRS
jgi:LDH2 family malate/lactate/ureidoglycolate dehydrogenase